MEAGKAGPRCSQKRPRRMRKGDGLGDGTLRVERTLPNCSVAQFSDDRFSRRAGARRPRSAISACARKLPARAIPEAGAILPGAIQRREEGRGFESRAVRRGKDERSERGGGPRYKEDGTGSSRQGTRMGAWLADRSVRGRAPNPGSVNPKTAARGLSTTDAHNSGGVYETHVRGGH